MIIKRWYKHLKFLLIITINVLLIKGCYSFSPQAIYSSNLNSREVECRKIQHELGESCIPLNPQRIIVTDQESLEALVALDVKPIATTIGNRVGSKANILKDKIKDITYLGKESQINIEKIVQLNPDLILGLSLSPQEYKLFSQIAPTVSTGYSHSGWQTTLIKVAKIIDKNEKAEEVLAQYQQRIAELRTAFAQKRIKPEISVMRFYTDLKFTQFFNQLSFPVSIMEDLKLSIPLPQRQVSNPHETYDTVSLERVDILEADAIFVAIDPGADENFQKYKNSPLWKTLNVVKNNRVYTVDSSYWVFGNVLSANAILDDLVKYLLSPS